MAKPASLTGSWSGAYRYPRGNLPETVFNCQIEDVGGAFTGSMQEPNLTQPGSADRVLTADIEGVRTGASVNFVKFYDGSGKLNHAVSYEGTVNAALTRIEGTWTIANAWSGAFFMTRDDEGDAAEAEVGAEATIEREH